MILKYFLMLIFRPRRAIEEIMRAEIKLRNMLVFLLSLGILRGIMETSWIFALSHKLPLLLCLSSSASWWILEGGPFLLANILTAYFRWAMYSLVFYLALRLFKISADFFQVLKIFSIILGLYVLTGIINFIHPWFNLSVIKFSFSDIYAPAFGWGQIISSTLLVWLIFNLGCYFNLDRFSALLSGVLVFALDRAFYFFAARLYFRSSLISGLAYRKVFWLGNYLSALVSLCLTFLFLWIGHTLNVKRKITL